MNNLKIAFLEYKSLAYKFWAHLLLIIILSIACCGPAPAQEWEVDSTFTENIFYMYEDSIRGIHLHKGDTTALGLNMFIGILETWKKRVEVQHSGGLTTTEKITIREIFYRLEQNSHGAWEKVVMDPLYIYAYIPLMSDGNIMDGYQEQNEQFWKHLYTGGTEDDYVPWPDMHKND